MIAVYLIFLVGLMVLLGYGKCRNTLAAQTIRKRSRVILIALVGCICSGYLWITEQKNENIVEGVQIVRNEYGEGSKQLKLVAGMDGEEEELSIEIKELAFTKAELDALLLTFLPQLDRAVLGQNESLDAIEENLQFVSEIQGFPFYVEWESGDYEWLDSQGKVRNETLQQEEIVTVSAEIVYEEYRWNYNFSVVIRPKILGERERITRELAEIIQKKEHDTRLESYVALPNEIQGKLISWDEKKKNTNIGIFFLTMVVAGLLLMGEKQERRKEEEERKRRLEQEYPDIISKLTLLLGAGMPLQGGIERLSIDYEKKKNRDGKISYACEELMIVSHEIHSGISESAAYTNFGHRCRLPCYKKLSTLLVRSLKKGSGNLLLQLENETKYALEEKKAAARRKGEEAGTKLLLPMMLMLLVVMILIIVPAFGGFSIT